MCNSCNGQSEKDIYPTAGWALAATGANRRAALSDQSSSSVLSDLYFSQYKVLENKRDTMLKSPMLYSALSALAEKTLAKLSLPKRLAI